jgi:serine protease Do
MKAGESLELALQRSDEKLTLSLTLAEPVAQRRTASSPTWEILGLDLKPIPEAEFKQSYPSTDYPGGLTVSAIRPQGPAAEQGIRRGDVLVGIDDRAMVSIDNVQWMLSRPDFVSLNPVKFYVLRGSQTLYGYLPINTAQLSNLRK